MLKYPVMIHSLLLSPKDAATDENSVIKSFICSFSIFGRLYYVFPIVNVFAKLLPFTPVLLLLILPSVHMNYYICFICIINIYY